MNVREDRRRAGFIISLEFLFIATCVLWLLIILWPTLRTKISHGLRELAAASSQGQDQTRSRAGPAAASRTPLPPPGYGPPPGGGLVIAPKDPQALRDQPPDNLVRFCQLPTLGTPRLRAPE